METFESMGLKDNHWGRQSDDQQGHYNGWVFYE